MQRLTESAKRSKTAHLLAQHRDIWLATQRQLAQSGKRGQRELDEWRCALVLSDKPDGRSFAEELMEMEAALLAERENLERDSVKLVWTLRTELKKWLASSRRDNSPIPSRAILDELGAVQLQLVAMATVLDHAYRECCSGLEHVRGMSPPSFLDCDGGVVPLDVQSLAWPNQESLEAIKVEFQALDERYRRSVAELESRFSHVLRLVYITVMVRVACWVDIQIWCVCVCVCMCVCVCVYVCVYMCNISHVCTCMCSCVCVPVYVHVCMYVHVHLCVCMYVWVKG